MPSIPRIFWIFYPQMLKILRYVDLIVIHAMNMWMQFQKVLYGYIFQSSSCVCRFEDEVLIMRTFVQHIHIKFLRIQLKLVCNILSTHSCIHCIPFFVLHIHKVEYGFPLLWRKEEMFEFHKVLRQLQSINVCN